MKSKKNGLYLWIFAFSVFSSPLFSQTWRFYVLEKNGVVQSTKDPLKFILKSDGSIEKDEVIQSEIGAVKQSFGKYTFDNTNLAITFADGSKESYTITQLPAGANSPHYVTCERKNAMDKFSWYGMIYK